MASLPSILIQLDGHERVLHGLVHQGVNAGHKEVDGAQQGFAILAEQLLGLSIVAKLVLRT